MKRAPLFLLFFLATSASFLFSTDKEKVEEGRYGILRNSALVKGSEHTWTLWRLPDGHLELEDHFEPDKELLSLTRGLLSPGMPASPEFKEDLRKSIVPTELYAIFTADRQLRSLKVSGVDIKGNIGVGLECTTDTESIECKGVRDKTKMRLQDARGLFWWFRVPPLLQQWSGCSGSSSIDTTKKVAVLSFGVSPRTDLKVGDKFRPGAKVEWGTAKPILEANDLKISSLGDDTLSLGGKDFRVRKCKLQIEFQQGDPISLTEWTDAKGVILAVEDAGNPGYRVGLIQYKNYSNMSPQSAAAAH